jgi:hypothetical protein
VNELRIQPKVRWDSRGWCISDLDGSVERCGVVNRGGGKGSRPRQIFVMDGMRGVWMDLVDQRRIGNFPAVEISIDILGVTNMS